ncbi:MAG TPA: hypothetical protein V6C65_36270 [Allocoleopsis sp.]
MTDRVGCTIAFAAFLSLCLEQDPTGARSNWSTIQPEAPLKPIPSRLNRVNPINENE